MTASYFRRDRRQGITPPDLSRPSTYAEHIVRARGRKTPFTSVSLDPASIRDFGDVLYELLRPDVEQAGHAVVEHAVLMAALREVATTSVKEDKLRALQAMRYARRRAEGLVHWGFDVSKVALKDRIQWASQRVAPFFRRKS